jgi:hypothetical protein
MVEHGEMLFMLKDKLYIHDTMFNHAKSSSWHNEPKLFEWVRKYDENHLVITDFSLHHVDEHTNPKKYAWLLESPVISPNAYEYIRKNYNKFDLIFTFSKELLSISDKFILTPLGGCWINDEDKNIHKKSKDVSIILSSKQSTVGHRLRHSILQKYPKIDFFGHNNHIDKKITALKDYRFSLIVENCKEDYYFSEKLIDSFVTGTIPIYWGCPSIGDFFDTNGMLIFDTLDELDSIMINLNEELYISKLESIKHNFEESKKYLVADNIIYNKLKEYESN